MTKINSLIAKHGEPALQNGVGIVAFVNGDVSDSVKKLFTEYTGFSWVNVFVREAVTKDDLFVVGGKSCRVFSSDEVRHRGVRVYSDVIAYEDDFIHDMVVAGQSMGIKGVNLPVAGQEKASVRVRIKTVTEKDLVGYSYHSEKVPTHVFSLEYQPAIEYGDVLAWGSRRFEVIEVVNVNEQNRLLVLKVVEVLNG